MPRSPANSTLGPLLHKLTQKLGDQQAKNELRWMVDHVRTKLTHPAAHPTIHKAARVWRDQPADKAERMRLTQVQWAWLRQAVRDRAHDKPLQYILGKQAFGRATIFTRPPVLIPRWETEEWVLRLARMIGDSGEKALRVVDMCSGSGCVALALKLELGGLVDVLGVDVSEAAVALALENRKANHAGGVRFKRLDLASREACAELTKEGPWDMIVANPPYVTPQEYVELDPSVRDWEDKRALVPDSDDPMGFIRRLAELASEVSCHTLPSCLPRLVVEIGGSHQVEATQQAMHDNGLNATEVWKDMAGTDRVVLGYSKPK